MDDLFEILTLAVLVLIVLGLFFLFSGEPDVWDALRAKAMAAAKS